MWGVCCGIRGKLEYRAGAPKEAGLASSRPGVGGGVATDRGSRSRDEGGRGRHDRCKTGRMIKDSKAIGFSTALVGLLPITSTVMVSKNGSLQHKI